MSSRSALRWRSSSKNISVFISFNFPFLDKEAIRGQLLIFFADSGLIDIISPPIEFYPDLVSLKKTVWEPLERFSWSPKQALDLSFLLMYAKDRGVFYLQLEDGVLAGKVGH